MATYSTNLKLGTPAANESGWAAVLDANRAALDASLLGSLAVSPKEVPSSTRNVRIAAGSFRAPDGSIVAVIAQDFMVDASVTRKVYLDAAGTPQQTGGAWPTTPHVRLATVVTGTSTVTSVTDERIAFAAIGAATGLTLVQTYATTGTTLAAYTPDDESAAYTGAADSEAKLADLNALRTAVENLRASHESLLKCFNALVDALQTRGDIG